MKTEIEKKYCNVYELIRKNIRYYRRVRNMTQADLAEKTQYSHEFIRRIEAPNCRNNFSIETVSNIADALDIDIQLLFAQNNEDITDDEDKE